jgi:hypothetical protein
VRGMVTIERSRLLHSPALVGADAIAVLAAMPGMSDVALEIEDAHRATISFAWKDAGVHSPGMDVLLHAEGMRVVR